MSDRIELSARRLYARTAYQNGISVANISKELNVHPLTVYKYIADIPKTQTRKVTVTPELTDQVRSMAECGLPRRTIASVTGLSPYTISKWVSMWGIRPRHQVDTMRSLQELGYNHASIAKHMNCCISTVRRHLGSQPESISNKTRKIAGALRRFKNQMNKLPIEAFEKVSDAADISA